MSGRRSRWVVVGALLAVTLLGVGGGWFVAPAQAALVVPPSLSTTVAEVIGPVGSVETKGIGLLGPRGLSTGPDGNLWFASVGTDTIARMTPDGDVTHFRQAGMREAEDLTAGPDGNLWFTISSTNEIGRITPTGVITRFSSPTLKGPGSIAAGPDGNLWFASWNSIGRITPAGVITTFSVPQPNPNLSEIVAGPDGAMWFTGAKAGQVGRITTAGDVTVVETGLSRLNGIAAGPDGNLWVTSHPDDTIVKITPGGTVTTFTGPDIVGPVAITTGPDGNLWFTSNAVFARDAVGRITPNGAVTVFAGSDIVDPQEIITGPDGNLWLASFYESDVVRMTTAGATTVFIGDRIAAPVSIARGHDGNMWFANFWTDSIGRVTPDGEFTDFALPPNSQPSTVAAGADGAMWFASWRNDYIGRITADGQYQLFRNGFIDSPRDLAVGPDGQMWFVTGNHHNLGRITSTGEVTPILTGVDSDSLVTGADGNVWISLTAGLGRVTPDGVLTILGQNQFAGARALVLGPDGNVWFGTDASGVGSMTPTGDVTLIPTGSSSSDLVVGPDGNIWSTNGVDRIDRITPAGQVDPFIDPIMDDPTAIAAGLHGELWFTNVGTSSIATIRAIEGEPEPPAAAFHGVVPQRILDSRLANVGFSGPVAEATPRTLQVSGLGGPSTVPWGATAVVMNLTVVGSTANSFVTVSPTGGHVTTASNLNFAAGELRANLVTVKLGAGGQVDIANAVGSTHVVADVVGYYYDDGTGPGGLFNPVTPVRLLDSRTSTGGWNDPLTAGTAKDLVVRQPSAATGVPTTATAVVANVTATRAGAPTFVSAWPSGVTQPTSSNLNLVPGQTVANLVTLEIGSNGAISFATSDAPVDVIVDLVGYFDPTTGLRFHAIDPTRVLDSRIGQGLVGAQGPGVSRNLTVGGAVGGPVPSSARALLANLTVVEPTAESFVAAFPGNVGRPVPYSNVNVAPGQIVANLTAVGLAPDGSMGLYNHLGSTDLVADAVGYYTATP